ncbi:MAG TPA: hypothetical protein VGE93_00030, partial [Bryobacteraceae bacterium]
TLMFRLKINDDTVRDRAYCTATIMPDTLPGLQKLLATTATADLVAPHGSGVSNAKIDTSEEYASPVPIWTVPPIGFEPTHPPPEWIAGSRHLRIPDSFIAPSCPRPGHK